MGNTFDIQQFRFDGELFLTQLMAELQALGVSVSTLRADHLCFRVESHQEYEDHKVFLAGAGILLTEANVNGRAISTYRMTEPFRAGNQVVELIELPAPKAGTEYTKGFEHAEFVIKESFDLFTAKFPHLHFTRSGNKNINPELCLKTRVGQAKFHYLSLDRVIEIEKAKIKDIIFDFDGTLIQSRENIYEINRIVFSEILEREISLTEAKEKFYPEFTKLFNAFGVECPLKKKRAISTWGKVSERYSYHLFDGVYEFLRRLSQSNCRIHLWTARDEKSARTILTAHKIDTFFTTMSFATDAESKPHENSLKFDWRSLDKNTIVVIGDSPSDIMGSKNIGAMAAAVLWDPHVNEQALISSGAELFFYDVPELETWLRER
ncbi:MAG: VOC family protein [Bdellovibrionota bacterium]